MKKILYFLLVIVIIVAPGCKEKKATPFNNKMFSEEKRAEILKEVLENLDPIHNIEVSESTPIIYCALLSTQK